MSDKTFRIAIARTGHFTDSQGRPQSFSEADLDAIAASYDPKKLEAPLVFGHPAAPACRAARSRRARHRRAGAGLSVRGQ